MSEKSDLLWLLNEATSSLWACHVEFCGGTCDCDKAAERVKRIVEAAIVREEALKPFAPGSGVWGRIKAFIVNGAPTREEGLALARQITEWQIAIPESAYAVASHPPPTPEDKP